VLAAVAIAAVYGVSDEFHQWFVPPRTVEAADVAAASWNESACLRECSVKIGSRWRRVAYAPVDDASRFSGTSLSIRD
jgi:hypothetical protein